MSEVGSGIKKFASFATLGLPEAGKEGATAAKKALTPDIPELSPPPPPPSRQSKAVDAAGDREREAAQLRRGRRASILTTARGVESQLGATRPRARAAKLLGE